MEKIRSLLHVAPAEVALPPTYVEQIEDAYTTPNGVFPAKFTIFGPRGESRRHLLGISRDLPLYAISRRDAKADNDKADVVLHNGLSRKDAVLSWCKFIWPTDLSDMASRAKTWRVRLPPSSGETDPSLEIVSAGIHWKDQKRPVFRFSIETDIFRDGDIQREEFEWRCSNNDGIRALLDGQSRGWKLVRMTEDVLTANIVTPKGVWPKSSEGKETVAVCSGNVEGGTKDWVFAFVGTGKSGMLGERWEVMAVMTSLLIMDWTIKIDKDSG